MYKILLSFLAGLILFPGPESHAQTLDDEDDTYLGLQVSIPLEASTRNTGLVNAEYSLLVVNRNSGITDGAVWTYDAAGRHTIGYLRPSETFTVGQSNIADYTLPLLSSEDGGGLGVNYQISGMDIVLYTIGGLYILGDVLEDALGDLFDRDDDDSDEESAETEATE